MLTFTASDPGSAGEGLTISLTATSVDGTTTQYYQFHMVQLHLLETTHLLVMM